MLRRLARTGACMGVAASLPAVLSWRKRLERIRISTTSVRIRIKPLAAIGEGRHLAG